MLYYYNNVKHFSLFLLDTYVEIYKIIENLNFKIFGIHLLSHIDFFNFKYLKFFLFYFYANFQNKDFFLDNFLLLNYSFFFKEKKGLIYFLINYDYFEYLFLTNFFKLDIFLNNFFFDSFLNYKFEHLFETSISNIHIYGKSDLLQVYSLELKKNDEFDNMVSYKNYKDFEDLKYFFLTKKDNYFIFLQKYFHLYNYKSYMFNYYYNFYTNLVILNFLIFIPCVISKIYIFICMFIVLFYCVYYIYINLLVFLNKKKQKNYFLLIYINKILILFLIFFAKKFKNNQMFINKEHILQKKNYEKLFADFYNFDLLLFIYNKFIIPTYGHKYKEYIKLLRIENIISTDVTLNQKNKSYKFIYNYFIFLLKTYYYIYLVFIYIYFFNTIISKLIILYKSYYIFFTNNFISNYILKLNLDGSYQFLIN